MELVFEAASRIMSFLSLFWMFCFLQNYFLSGGGPMLAYFKVIAGRDPMDFRLGRTATYSSYPTVSKTTTSNEIMRTGSTVSTVRAEEMSSISFARNESASFSSPPASVNPLETAKTMRDSTNLSVGNNSGAGRAPQDSVTASPSGSSKSAPSEPGAPSTPSDTSSA